MSTRRQIVKAISEGRIPEEGSQVLYLTKHKATVLGYKGTTMGIKVHLKLDDFYGLEKWVYFSQISAPQGELRL